MTARTPCSSTRRRTCGRPACSARCRSASSWTSTYVGRRGLYLQRERNINQLAAGHHPGEPRREHRRPASVQGIRRIRLSENAGDSKYNSLQISADRRYKNGFKFGVAYTLGKSEDNAQRQARRAVQHLRRHRLLGQLELRPPPRVQLLLHLRPAVLARPDHADARTLLGGWQISGATFMRTRHAVCGSPDSNDIAGVGDTLRPARGIWSATSKANANSSSRAGPGPRTTGSTRRRSRGRRAGTFGNAPRNNIYNPGQQQWDIALFKNVSARRSTHSCSSGRRSSTS